MDTTKTALHPRTRLFAVVSLLLVLVLQLVYMTRNASSSWDEPHHLYDGYNIWKQHDYTLNPEVPPLLKLVAALPLLQKHLVVPPNQNRPNPKEAFLDGRAFVFNNGADNTLQPARYVCMAFTLLLALLIFLWSQTLFGEKSALYTLALFCFDPTILAFGTIVTTDIAAASGFLATLYAFHRYTQQPTAPKLLLTALAAGLLLATKFTGIFFLPMLVLVVLLQYAFKRNGKLLLRRLGSIAGICLVAWAILWSFYGFRYKAAPTGRDLNPNLNTYLAKMYDQADARHLATLAHFHVLPEAYLWGLENTKQTEFEDTSYFWGKVYRHGNWEYFPVAMLIKSTLPFLLLLALTHLALRQGLARNREALVALFVPIAVYLAIAMHSDMDIGIRHVIPVYAFLYVLLGGVVAVLFAGNVRWAGVFAILLVWQVVTSARVAPDYIAYGNEAWGGPSQVHRYLSDANVDWGQQLKAVKTYLDTNHIANCWFAYFPDGAIEPSDYGVHCKRLPTANTLYWLNLPSSVPPEVDGTVLISDSDLAGIEFGDGALNPYESFRHRTPDAIIQHGVYMYTGHFALPLASALNTAHDAEALSAAGHPEEALTKAQSAAQLAPNSAAVQSTYGDLLAACSHSTEALQHYEQALEIARSVRPDLEPDVVTELEKKIIALKSKQAP